MTVDEGLEGVVIKVIVVHRRVWGAIDSDNGEGVSLRIDEFDREGVGRSHGGDLLGRREDGGVHKDGDAAFAVAARTDSGFELRKKEGRFPLLRGVRVRIESEGVEVRPFLFAEFKVEEFLFGVGKVEGLEALGDVESIEFVAHQCGFSADEDGDVIHREGGELSRDFVA